MLPATRAQFPDGFPRSLGSGICLKGVSGETVELWVLGDRGPNGDGPEGDGRDSKIFPVPDFNPAFGILKLQRHKAEVAELVNILDADGGKTSGLPNPPIAAEATQEFALSEALTALPVDPDGIDPEAIAYDGQFIWLSDEYGPFVLKVHPASGRILERLAPGRGLPTVFAKRRSNRGMGRWLMTTAMVAYGEHCRAPSMTARCPGERTASPCAMPRVLSAGSRSIRRHVLTVSSPTPSMPTSTGTEKQDRQNSAIWFPWVVDS